MRRVRLSQSYWDGKVTISGKDSSVMEVPTRLSPIKIELPDVELIEDEDCSADEACQQLIEDAENAML